MGQQEIDFSENENDTRLRVYTLLTLIKRSVTLNVHVLLTVHVDGLIRKFSAFMVCVTLSVNV